MRPVVKTGLVVAGYVAAFAIAAAVVAIYVAVTNSPARQSSSGMYAFGDTVVFLAVFAIAALPATGAALFFLRPCSSLWLVLSVVAPVTAVTGLVALIVYAAVQTTHAQSVLNAWSGISVLRIFAAPFFALAFLLCGLFAPNRFARMALLISTACETAVFCCIIFMWLRS